MIEFSLIIVAVVAVVLFVAAPLRAGTAREQVERQVTERAALEAARDAKYREIRDAELDYKTGKLSEADWRAQDRQLRHEAITVLGRLDRLDGGPNAGTPASIA